MSTMTNSGTSANDRPGPRARNGRWVIGAAITLAAILLPFVLFAESMDRWTLQQIQAQARPLPIASWVVALLMADIVLPVPASLVSTLAGALLGVTAGFAASVVGMTLTCQIGYALGRWSAPLAQRLISDEEMARVSKQVNRRGMWAFAMLRPIPVLAEASAFWAGVMQVNPLRFSAVTLMANSGLSLLYAAVGAAAIPAGSVTLILAAAIALPAFALLIGFRKSGATA
jgi:uncharacterized membrane protein YdjX (TVP38/TMEM64 family)